MRLITVILKTDGFKIVRHGNNTLYLNCRHCVPDSVVNLSDQRMFTSVESECSFDFQQVTIQRRREDTKNNHFYL